MTARALPMSATLVVAAALLVSCGESRTRSTAPTLSPAPSTSSGAMPSSAPEPPPTASPHLGEAVDTSSTGAIVSDGHPRRATLSVPGIGLHGLVVVPYRGRTDDAGGTRIQDRGLAASPYGPHGGVGPGGLGNYQITAHRTSSTQAFRTLPSLRVGQLAIVTTGGVRYVYEIRRTRQTSFRSARSLAEQRAPVPGHPGARPTRAYLTLSTCATLEDHAAGNYWADELHNPEHRIDKIGVLVRTTAI
jgi:sortase A